MSLEFLSEHDGLRQEVAGLALQIKKVRGLFSGARGDGVCNKPWMWTSWWSAAEERIRLSLDLIAALNSPGKAVLDAQNSVFAIRRFEGYPRRRYHGGTTYLDAVEDLARERAKQPFGAEHANVQPHSRVNANWTVYFAVL
jgi:hypothetical protein